MANELVTEIIKYASNTQNIIGIFASYGVPAVSTFLKAVVNETTFDKILTSTILETNQVLYHQKQIEVLTKDFKKVFSSSLESLISKDQIELNLKEIIQNKLKSDEIIYFENEDDTDFYCSEAAKVFCIQLFRNLLDSDMYKPIILANFQQSVTTSLREIGKDTKDIKEKVYGIDEKMDSLSEVVSKISNNKSYITKEDLTYNAKEKQGLSKDIIEKLETIEKDLDTVSPVKKAKLTKELGLLLYSIPVNHNLVGEKVLRQFIATSLALNTETSEKIINEYQNSVPNEFKTAYTNSLIAAHLINIGNPQEAIRILESINKSDIYILSDKQRDSFYRIYSMAYLNIQNIDKAKEYFHKIKETKTDDVVYLELIIFRDDNKNLDQKADKLLSDNPTNIDYVATIGNYYLSRYESKKSELGGNPFKSYTQFKDQLLKVYELLQPLCEDKDDFSSLGASLALIVLFNIAHLSNKTKDLDKLVIKALDNGLSEPQLIVNYAINLFLRKEYQNAAKYFDKVSFDRIVIHNGLLAWVETYKELNLLNEVKTIKNNIDTYSFTQRQKDQILLHIKRVTENENDLFSFIESIKGKYESEEWIWRDIAEINSDLGHIEEAEKAYLKSLEIDPTNAKTISLLGRFYAVVKQDDSRAIQYFEKIVNKDTPDAELNLYVSSIFNTKNYPKTIQLVEEFDPNENRKRLQYLRSYSLFSLGYIDLSIKIIKKHIHNGIPSEQELLNYTIALFQKYDLDELLWAHEQLLKFKPNDKNFNFNYSRLLLNKQRYDDAIIAAKKALQHNFDDDKFHFNYFITFIETSRKNNDSSALKNKENLELFQDVRDNFEIRFPNSNLLTSLPVKFKDDGSLDVEDIKKLLKEINDYNEHILETYYSNAIPASSVGKALSRNIFETWGVLISTSMDQGLIAEHTYEGYLKSELELLQQYDEILLDSLTLITLATQKHLHLLENSGKKIILTASTKLEFEKIKKSMQFQEEGQMTLACIDGQLVREEKTKKQIDYQSEAINSILNFIENHAEIRTAPTNYQDELKSSISKFISDEYNEILYLSKSNNLLSVTTDGRFKSFLLATNIKTCGIHAFITFFYLNKQLSANEFNNLKMNLILFNYRSIQYKTTDCALFLSSSDNEERKTFLLNRIFYSKDFNSEEHRITFIGEIFGKLAQFSPHPWPDFTVKVDEYLNTLELDSDLLEIFGLTCFSPFFNRPDSIEFITETFDKLSLTDTNGNKFTSFDAKNCISQRYANILQSEQETLDSILSRNKDEE